MHLAYLLNSMSKIVQVINSTINNNQFNWLICKLANFRYMLRPLDTIMHFKIVLIVWLLLYICSTKYFKFWGGCKFFPPFQKHPLARVQRKTNMPGPANIRPRRYLKSNKGHYLGSSIFLYKKSTTMYVIRPKCLKYITDL